MALKEVDILLFSERKPKFDARDLTLYSGSFAGKPANKNTLQALALEQVRDIKELRVPGILTQEQIQKIFEDGESLRVSNEGKYWDERLYKRKHIVYGRGVIDDWRDGLLVDLTPSGEIESDNNRKQFEHRLGEDLRDRALAQYLKINFNIDPKQLHTSCFYQELIKGKYCSVWEMENYKFVVFSDEDQAPWATFDQDITGREYAIIDSKEHYYDHGGAIGQILLPAIDKLNRKLNETFRRPMAFRHDFLFDGNNTYLIQTRATHFLDDDLIEKGSQQIEALLNAGVLVINKEIGGLRGFGGNEPRQPFVLRLSNREHLGALRLPDLIDLNLSQMRGLILPEYLRGGMLAHGAWNIISMALYWGLPITFE